MPEKQFNVVNLKNKINEEAIEIKRQIKNEVKNEFISLKMDVVTRLSRSILGVNVQYVKNNELKIKTIGIKKLCSRHTATY